MKASGRLAVVGVIGLLALGVMAPVAGARESAVVAMGDSAMSGESAGDYEPGTDQPGNYCHRSLDALIHETAIPGASATLNLACSGATSANLRIGGPGQYGEPSQSEKLRAAATTYRVRLIVVEVGTNDDPHFARVATHCVSAYVLQTAGCRFIHGPSWAAEVG